MSSLVLKARPNLDLYCLWSESVEAPIAVGDRDYMFRYLVGSLPRPGLANDPEGRLKRADARGTSALGDYAWCGAWDDSGFMVQQKGFLPRARLAEFLAVWDENHPEKAYALLDPLED